jgi:hypothetical protein
MSKYISGIYSADALISAAGVATMYGGISTDGVNAFTFPTAAGTGGYVLTSNGSGGTSWASAVTSVAASVPAFLSISGSPITSTGTLAIGLSGSALPVTSGGLGVTTLGVNAVLLGNGTGGVLSPAGITYASGTLTLPSIVMNTLSISGTPSTTGIYLSIGGNTLTDNATAASGTTAAAVFTSFAQPTLAAANIGVTTTSAATMYIAGGPIAGANETITGSYGLWNSGKTRLDDILTITNTTDATSATDGGTLTTNGGAAVGKQLYVGSNTFITGNVGIGTTTANGMLQFPNNFANRKIVLWEGSNSDNDYVGFGLNSPLLRYQCLATSSFHVFYAGVNSTTSVELFRIAGTGIISAPGTTVSTSSTTGVLTLAGGIGISDTTDAVSATNGGTFTSAGGGSFAKSLWVGSTITAPFLTLNNSGTSVPLLINMTNTNSLAIMSRMFAASLNTGYDCETWLGVSASNYNCMIMRFNYVAATQTTNYLDLGFYGANNLFLLYGSGVVKITTNIASTSSTTGVLTLVGGLGIANTTDATSATNGGGLTCAGGGAFAKSLWVGSTLSAAAINVNAGSVNVPVYFYVTGTGSVEILRMWATSLANGNNCQFTLGVGASSLNCGTIQFNYIGSNNTGNNVGIGMYAANNVLQVYNNNVKVTNTANTGNPFIFNLVAPNMATGTYTEMHIGVAESNYNTGIINFNYASAGASGTAGNSLGLGIYGGLNMMQIYSNAVKMNGQLNINMPGSGLSVPLSMLAPSLNTGTDLEMQFGVSGGGMNAGIIQFNYVGSGQGGTNTGNNVGFGFFGNNNVMRIYQGGVTVNGVLSKNSGTFDIPHPDPAKQKQRYRLRHSFVESNTRGDNIYRYTATTSGCKAEIRLPDYFKYLNENPQVIIAPVDILGIGRGWVDDELENVHIETSMDGTYNVILIGTRKDKLAVEQFDPLGIEYIEDN